jgi:hypothetical protein
MKKQLLSLLLFSCSFAVFGQNSDWFKSGAYWQYYLEEAPPIETAISYPEVVYRGLATFNGEVCHRLRVNELYEGMAGDTVIYMLERNDSVFLAKSMDTQFHLVYNFNLLSGDTSVTHVFPDMIPKTYIVDSVFVDETGSEPLRGQRIRFVDWYGGPHIVRERIGGYTIFSISDFSFPLCVMWFGLNCYRDDAYNANGCVSQILETPLVVALELAPNPTSGRFTLRLPNEQLPAQVVVLDGLGRQFLAQTVTNETETLDLPTHTPAGMYVVRARLDDGRMGTGKIVVAK